MGKYGRLALVQEISGAQDATTPVVSRHETGGLIIQDGTFILEGPEGPMALSARAAWQAPDAAVLAEAMRNAEFVEEHDIPVPTPREGYRRGVTTVGYVVKLRAEDAVALGCELSPVRFTQPTGEITEISGCIVVTQKAVNAMGLTGFDVSYDTHETKPIDVADLASSVAYVRANGPVSYSVTFNNGDHRESFGFPKGTQRQAELDNNEAKLANSILNVVSPGTLVRAQQPQNSNMQQVWNGQRRRSFRAPAVTY